MSASLPKADVLYQAITFLIYRYAPITAMRVALVPSERALMSLPLLPFKELLEQGVFVLRAQVPAITLFGEKLREVAPRIRQRCRIRVLREPILRRFEAGPTGQRGGERDFLPLGMEGRFWKSLIFAKKTSTKCSSLR